MGEWGVQSFGKVKGMQESVRRRRIGMSREGDNGGEAGTSWWKTERV